MREILFRGKRIDNGEWVEGFYVGLRPNLQSMKPESCHRIYGLNTMYYEIDPETLSQYTGLKDKNGNRIWENDILKGFTYPFFCDGEFNYFAIVEWAEEYKYFFMYTMKNPTSIVRGISEGNSELFENFDSDDWKVIGNTFDNLELLDAE